MSRGKRKPSLRDLSGALVLDDHITDILSELDAQTDRGSALIAAALVDTYLKRAMMCRLAGDKDFPETVFEKEGAPLGTFSARIKMARALGTIGPRCEGDLNIIRHVRNQFAHSVMKIDFKHPLISAECRKLSIEDEPTWKPELSEERRRYIGAVIMMSQALESELVRLAENPILQGLD